ncbi:CLUMA_CG016095, isoform A [Clunio marinus]|uniref:CLUMA_CG016095, isoform A n=1 Tax=Clunio marinus TaxID=568069 RepID=A0A1J1IW20_9DIPT|nr:CLUMA_CG016095, isoform A [Clunio marinus]
MFKYEYPNAVYVFYLLETTRKTLFSCKVKKESKETKQKSFPKRAKKTQKPSKLTLEAYLSGNKTTHAEL